MLNPTLIIYDNTGRVWGLYCGETTVPEGVQGIIADIPMNLKSIYVNPDTKEAVFDIAPDTEEEVTDLQNAIIELEERVAQLEEATR